MNNLEKKYFMKQAFLEAYRAMGTTGKNPNVGCVLVKNKFIIARARTSPGGRPHAEENLISQLSKKELKGSSLFVTLEPCAHKGINGKSCAELISNSGIKEIFISNFDPDLRTSGKGVEIIKKSNIDVNTEFLINEGIELNNGYLSNHTSRRPFVTIKFAISLDGKIALKNKNSKWISNELSRNFGHMLRAFTDGILTTNSTIEKDNSKLTCRLNGLEKYSPVKIIVDRELKLNKNYSIFKNTKKDNLIIYHCTNDQSKIRNYPKNTNLIYIKSKKNFLNHILKDLSDKKIKHLLIESGSTFCTEMFNANLVDQIAFFRSGKVIGNDGLPFVNELNLKKISDTINMKVIDFKFFNNDIYELRRFC
ncbi:bifunctional diaminohydroxyphosphoribosylaminopyrimidine deaminase/5-amino-6-(5-phosphoribosylamino)uracil reductase RibD [Alphaproteobacteria bacterium]|nr:bifunctional diaminohydroxyphosphoribosylaminopyrimidine deaminase/5-amino-6-(5-phosphoribosylamino)uracil reductase RibD [Alphaproteobacteria bacterium]